MDTLEKLNTLMKVSAADKPMSDHEKMKHYLDKAKDYDNFIKKGKENISDRYTQADKLINNKDISKLDKKELVQVKRHSQGALHDSRNVLKDLNLQQIHLNVAHDIAKKMGSKVNKKELEEIEKRKKENKSQLHRSTELHKLLKKFADKISPPRVKPVKHD